MKPSLCLNVIVKNEAARIERCLASVTATVKAIHLHDTGSTDDTVALAEAFAEKHDVPISVSFGEFKDFSQARNEAFAAAREANGATGVPWCQFALLMDADMELVVDDPAAFDVLSASALSYDMMQKGGALSYANRRIVNLDVKKDIYVGVTHEYIDVAAAGMIKGAWFRDHADGANRGDKYPRDVALLETALKKDPTNGRNWYYLGNTYADWGMPELAMNAYDRRIKLGGWDEEVHSATMRMAQTRRDQSEPEHFVSGMIAAYNFRPQRAEPLYELAKYYREKGDNAAALLFAKIGVGIKRPDDVLFVNDFVYSHGLRYEYSIAGYYVEAERDGAFQTTNALALDPTCPADLRWSARSNLYWYTQPLKHYCPSFRGGLLKFTAPEGYTAMNPSIQRHNVTGFLCNVRCVNYKIDEHGRYMIGPKECNDAPIDTRNFVCELSSEFDVLASPEILWQRPEAQFPMVTGLEDVRLYRHGNEQWFSACVREQASNGTCQQIRGRIDADIDPHYKIVSEWSAMSGEDAIEKNWMPVVESDHDFVYRLDTVYHANGAARVATVSPTSIYCNDISGSSQAIPFKAGYLAVVHEASTGPDGKRTYWHRFVWFDMDMTLRRISLPFVFYARQIEFCAGLCAHPNGSDLVLSFGVRDAEAHLATVNIEEVSTMLWKFHED
jgi:glycosyltransferase involved in cell wall biosynthesis